jgi:hypothetical protein
VTDSRANYTTINITSIAAMDDIQGLVAKVEAAAAYARGFSFEYTGVDAEGRERFKNERIDLMLKVNAAINDKAESAKKPREVWEVTCQHLLPVVTGDVWVHHRIGLFEDAEDALSSFEKLQEACASEPPYYRNPRVQRVEVRPKGT